jgi:hypothetical protein
MCGNDCNDDTEFMIGFRAAVPQQTRALVRASSAFAGLANRVFRCASANCVSLKCVASLLHLLFDAPCTTAPWRVHDFYYRVFLFVWRVLAEFYSLPSLFCCCSRLLPTSSSTGHHAITPIEERLC